MKQSTTNVFIIIGIVVLVLVLLCCLSIAGFFILASRGSIGMPMMKTTKTSELLTNSTPVPTLVANIPTPQISVENDEAANRTKLTLNEMIIPESDPIDLAERLSGKQNVPKTLIDTHAPYHIGDGKAFWVMNTDTTKVSSIETTLRYKGNHIYIWIDNRVNYNKNALTTLGDIIDQEIVPTNREFFGTEWNPGVDGDERFHILYAKGIGRWVAGYFSSADEVHPDAHPYSNAHEMFLLSADNVQLNDSYILGTIAHEYQHMIHWYLDKNEESWVNEGFSMLAEQVNGYDTGGFDWTYLQNTDMQLNDWDAGDADNSAHYGASYLFMSYYLDRFGEEATRALVAHKENGFAAIDEVSKELRLLNPDNNQPYTGIEIFAYWTVANLLQNSRIQNKRYDYQSYSPYSLKITESILSCPESIQRDVHQFGADYIEIKCDGIDKISFQGNRYVKVLPIDDIPSGSYFWWSSAADESNMSLQREFDLTNVTGKVTFSFSQWYDIETDYDYAYLTATTDGINWDMLKASNCTELNPSGNNFGCGWTGTSDGWEEIEVDLSAYAGQKVTLRFDYVTDAAVNSHGMVLDDFMLEAIGYSDDVESGEGDWISQGFVRIQNILPQDYVVSVVRYGNQISVEHHFVSGDTPLKIELSQSPAKGKVIIIVSGTTLFTRQKTDYQILFGEQS